MASNRNKKQEPILNSAYLAHIAKLKGSTSKSTTTDAQQSPSPTSGKLASQRGQSNGDTQGGKYSSATTGIFCKAFQKGNCKRRKCPFRHELPDTEDKDDTEAGDEMKGKSTASAMVTSTPIVDPKKKTSKNNETFTSDISFSKVDTDFDQSMSTPKKIEQVDAKPFYCNVCSVDCKNARSYQSHIRGAIHSQKARDAEKEQKAKESAKDSEGQEAEADGDTSTFCSACNIQCKSEKAYQNHIKGMMHAKKVENGQKPQASSKPPAQPSKVSPKPTTQSASVSKPSPGGGSDKPFYCSVCNIDCATQKAYQNHTRGLIHTQKVMENENIEGKDVQDAYYGKQSYQESEPLKDVKKTIQGTYMPTKPIKQAGKDDHEFYCEICDCLMTGEASYNSHMEGSRHLKNVKNRAIGARIKKGRSKTEAGEISAIQDTPGVARAQMMVDNADGPLIGLQHITEFVIKLKAMDPRYVCNLCSNKCDINTLISHVSGSKHRLNYMKEHFMNYYTQIRQIRVKKSDLSRVVEDIAVDIERFEGRGKIKVKYINSEEILEKNATALLAITKADEDRRKRRAPPPGAFVFSKEHALGREPLDMKRAKLQHLGPSEFGMEPPHQRLPTYVDEIGRSDIRNVVFKHSSEPFGIRDDPAPFRGNPYGPDSDVGPSQGPFDPKPNITPLLGSGSAPNVRPLLGQGTYDSKSDFIPTHESTPQGKDWYASKGFDDPYARDRPVRDPYQGDLPPKHIGDTYSNLQDNPSFLGRRDSFDNPPPLQALNRSRRSLNNFEMEEGMELFDENTNDMSMNRRPAPMLGRDRDPMGKMPSLLDGDMGPRNPSQSLMDRDMGFRNKPQSFMDREMGEINNRSSFMDRDMDEMNRPPSLMDRGMGQLNKPLSLMDRDVGPMNRSSSFMDRKMGTTDEPPSSFMERNMDRMNKPPSLMDKDVGPMNQRPLMNRRGGMMDSESHLGQGPEFGPDGNRYGYDDQYDRRPRLGLQDPYDMPSQSRDNYSSALDNKGYSGGNQPDYYQQEPQRDEPLDAYGYGDSRYPYSSANVDTPMRGGATGPFRASSGPGPLMGKGGPSSYGDRSYQSPSKGYSQPPLPPREPTPPPPPLPSGDEPGRQGSGPDFHNMIGSLSKCLVNNEEEASMALQVSNALTQALISFRVKNAPRGMPMPM